MFLSAAFNVGRNNIIFSVYAKAATLLLPLLLIFIIPGLMEQMGFLECGRLGDRDAC